jgi:hypothetical protein
MELVNETNLAAALFRSQVDQTTPMMATVVAKATYRLQGDGPPAREIDAQLPVDRDPVQTLWGELPADMVPWKHGVDVFVLGRAYAPALEPVESTQVVIRAGSLTQRIDVIGDRFWQKRGDEFVATTPTRFTEMPLGWAHAFGGGARVSAGEVPHEYNAAGKGFILDPDEIEGTPLPNLEDPDRRIRQWRDSPLPLAPGAVALASRFLADDMLEPDPEDERTVRFRQLSFNRAHPKLRLDRVTRGERVEIDGMAPEKTIEFEVPVLDLDAHVWLEGTPTRHYTFPLRADTIGVLVEERVLFVVYRCLFTYSFIEQEARLTRLRERRAPGVASS